MQYKYQYMYYNMHNRMEVWILPHLLELNHA